MNTLSSESKFTGNSFFWLSAFLLLALNLVLPENAPWINDEARLFKNALQANAKGELARVGLLGSINIPYGPVPTWIYQFALLFTRSLPSMVFVKSLATALVVFVSLYLLAKQAKLKLTPLLLIFVSPFLYYYGRLLWDNCFLVPLSALLFVCYAHLTQHKSFAAYLLSLFLIWLLLEVHLVSLFLIIPYAAVLFLCERDWLLRKWRQASLALVVMLACTIPYAKALLSASYMPFNSETALAQRILNALSGINFFTFSTFPELIAPQFISDNGILSASTLNLFQSLTFIAVLFFTLGFVGWLAEIVQFKFKVSNLEQKLSLFAGLTVIATVCAYALNDFKHQHHYLNAVWFPFFYFVWRFLNHNLNRLWVKLSFGALLFSLTTLLVVFIYFINTHSGSRDNRHGPTIGAQLEVVKEVVKYSRKSEIDMKVFNYRYYPHSFEVLRKLYREKGKRKPKARLEVDYAEGQKEHAGRLVVRVERGEVMAKVHAKVHGGANLR